MQPDSDYTTFAGVIRDDNSMTKHSILVGFAEMDTDTSLDSLFSMTGDTSLWFDASDI